MTGGQCLRNKVQFARCMCMTLCIILTLTCSCMGAVLSTRTISGACIAYALQTACNIYERVGACSCVWSAPHGDLIQMGMAGRGSWVWLPPPALLNSRRRPIRPGASKQPGPPAPVRDALGIWDFAFRRRCIVLKAPLALEQMREIEGAFKSALPRVRICPC